MGGAIAEGLLESGFPAGSLTLSNRSAGKLERFAERGARTTTDNRNAVLGADTVILAVKPWLVGDVIDGIRDSLDYSTQRIISVAAGIKGEKLLSMLAKADGSTPRAYTVIPNTAIAVGCSTTFVVPVQSTDADLEAVRELFGRCGEVFVIDEAHLSAATSLSSCGIAYAMRYIRAASEGGVEVGFKAAEAEKIVLQTVKGAVSLLQATGKHPEEEIDKVTTPGGLTIKGLNEMEHAGFTSAVIRGIKASMS